MIQQLFHRILAFGLLVIFLAASGSAGASSAEDWWDKKWEFRKKIAINTTDKGADVKEALTDFPVLVRLHTGNFNFGGAKKDGSDIRFIGSDGKTPLKFHIEKFDNSAEMALVWVKVPRIAPSSAQEFVWLYYGNSSVAAGQDPGGTYDTAQLAVFHFDKKEGIPGDATAYGNHGKEFTGKLGTVGTIGSGATLKGGTERLVIGKSPSLNLSKGFTFSAWVRPAASQQDGRLFSWDDGSQSVIIGVDGTKLYCAIAGQKQKVDTGKVVDLTPGKWVQVTVTAEAGKAVTIYTDGRERTSQKIAGSLPEPAADITIGAALPGKNAFAGDIDEAGIGGVARSPAWVRAQAVGQGPETPMLSYQEEQASSTGLADNLTIHLLIVTARAVTLDGWIIIGMIVLMCGWTWALFVNKTIVLRKIRKDNASFFESFTQSRNLDEMKDMEDDFEESSLFRVYRAGMEELERRLAGKDSAGGTTLSSKAMNVFRTALSKASLFESKRNAAGLIVFTLSISGGPFMGLFGTVWGVINTFAGVAEAGEANLAAIAPGVASALACTLMGLALAIPALFQYSYLTQEIKNTSADMNVFIGEFMTRVEETFGGRE